MTTRCNNWPRDLCKHNFLNSFVTENRGIGSTCSNQLTQTFEAAANRQTGAGDLSMQLSISSTGDAELFKS